MSPDVYDAPESPAERWEISTYEFAMDEWTDSFMILHDFKFLVVTQFCDGGDPGQHANSTSTNWVSVPFVVDRKNRRAHKPYRLELPRCEEGNNLRKPSAYEVSLCKGPSIEECEVECGPRKLRPVNPVTKKPTFAEAVELVDPVLWVCNTIF